MYGVLTYHYVRHPDIAIQGIQILPCMVPNRLQTAILACSIEDGIWLFRRSNILLQSLKICLFIYSMPFQHPPYRAFLCPTHSSQHSHPPTIQELYRGEPANISGHAAYHNGRRGRPSVFLLLRFLFWPYES